MKYTVVCLTFLLAATRLAYGVDPEYMVKVQDAVNKCKLLHKISEDSMKLILQMEIAPDDEEEKCFLGCLLEDIGIIKNNAYDWSYHKGVSKLKYDDEDDINKANQVVEKCRDSVSININSCQLGYDIMNCNFKAAKMINLGPPIWS